MFAVLLEAFEFGKEGVKYGCFDASGALEFVYPFRHRHLIQKTCPHSPSSEGRAEARESGGFVALTFGIVKELIPMYRKVAILLEDIYMR